MLIVFTVKFEIIAVIPTIKNVMHCVNELSHLSWPFMPRHTETPGNMRLYLCAKAKNESAITKSVQIMGQMRHAHWVAGEGNGNRGNQLNFIGVLCSER